MSYTPVELRHVRVGRSLFGYNRAMVEQVIEEVAESFESTWRERGELADKVESLEKQLVELRQREDLLTQTLLAAERTATDMRDRAHREAEAIVTEAHTEARAIGRSAQAERERLLAEARRIEAMLRAALGMIEEGASTDLEPTDRNSTGSHQDRPAEVPARAVSAGPIVPLPPVQDERPAPVEAPSGASWGREDTREFEPIGGAEVDESQDEETGGDAGEAAEALLHRLPGSESRDFDWGE